MKIKNILLIAIASYILIGCSKEEELQKSIFIEDTEYSGLPKYSEWGYNTFGAYYDRQPFVSTNDKVSAKVVCNNGVTSFNLIGQLGSYYYYEDENKMALSFKIPDFLPADFSDLSILNDTILDLTNTNYKVLISFDSEEYEAQILNGFLHFKRAQNLIVDKKSTEVILSGIFEFQALINEEPVTVSNGRFDVGIGLDNFYNY